MKQLNTIICSILFVIAGALSIGLTKDRASPTIFPGNATVYATPQIPMQLPNVGLPLDLQLDLNKGAKTDTVYVTDTVTKIEYKTKIRKVTVPEVVEKHDTLCVPIFYIATPLEYEVESIEIRATEDIPFGDSKTNQTDSIAHNN